MTSINTSYITHYCRAGKMVVNAKKTHIFLQMYNMARVINHETTIIILNSCQQAYTILSLSYESKRDLHNTT